MSTTLDTNIELKKIKAPSLTSSEYGKNIREQFDNIDENFRRVSNSDYVQGKPGSNVGVTELPLMVKDADSPVWDFTSLGQSMINSITGVDINWNLEDPSCDWDENSHDFTDSFYSDHPEFSPVSYEGPDTTITVHFYDYVKINPNISVFYTLKDPEDVDGLENDVDYNRDYICSPQVYTFLDQRYANVEEHGGINRVEFKNEQQDTSCLLSLKYSENVPTFTRSNLFPTIYYDPNDKQFKWQIYDNKTGIRAQGPKGDSGSSTSLWIVRTADVDSPDYIPPVIPNPNIVQVVKVAILTGTESGWEWKDITLPDTPSDQKPKTGDACVVLTNVSPSDSDDSSVDASSIADAFVSPAFEIAGDVFVTVNEYNAINGNSTLNSLLNQLQQIHNGEILGGLFVPYNDRNGAHFMYDGPANETHTLHIQPKAGTSLDMSHPESNNFDNNSKLDIKYGEISSVSVNNTTIRSTEGNIGIYTDDDTKDIEISSAGGVELKATDGQVYISTTEKEIKIITEANDIDIDSNNNVNISVGDGNNVNITGDTVIGKSDNTKELTVNGSETINGFETITGTLTVGSNETVYGNLTVGGNTILGDTDNTKSTTINGNLNVLQGISSLSTLKLSIIGTNTDNYWGNYETSGKQFPVYSIKHGGIIYGTDRPIAWRVDESVPEGTVIMIAGGSYIGWNNNIDSATPASGSNPTKAHYVFTTYSDTDGYRSVVGGIYIVLGSTLYLISSNYHGQAYVGQN